MTVSYTVRVEKRQAVVACGTCVYGAVTLIPAGVRMTKPTTKTLANTAAGCRRMNVVCTLPQPGMMEFNRAKAGPYEGKSITVLLTCGADKKWRFTNNGAVTMIPNTPQGCRQMRIICNTPAGYTKSNMVFNGTEPPKVGKNVNALISCFKASWHTTFMGSYIEILMINYSVFCLVAFMAIYSCSEAAPAKKPLREFKFHEVAGVFFATFSIFYTTKTCATCLPREVQLTPADEGTQGSVTPVFKMLPNAKGCRQMNVICPTPKGFTRTQMMIPQLCEMFCQLNCKKN
ncbi:hypothetical protein RB195_003421 [Necator americanus]|uniref:Uncharacterized protein n=1 Tax=Necator americanus TaxID=51031 RepID=A0ABR1DNG8_NECAM